MLPCEAADPHKKEKDGTFFTCALKSIIIWLQCRSSYVLGLLINHEFKTFIIFSSFFFIEKSFLSYTHMGLWRCFNSLFH